ncbi:MAG: hypothetical protein Q9222_000884 [Ikaeria aurantiellina]
MIASSRKWLNRNRNKFAVGAGVLGAGYVAGQYILSKVAETRQRMSEDRIAKEKSVRWRYSRALKAALLTIPSLRRRFQQNQEDCTITVLALLPTATDNVLQALPVERITHDLQQKKAERLGKSGGLLDSTSPLPSSGPSSVADDDAGSLTSFQSEGYVHASQMAASKSAAGESELQKPAKSRAQLWNELKITSITRAFTLLYTLSLLTLLTRIQLNLLGRRNYLASVVSMASHSPQDPTISLENLDDDNIDQTYGNDFETNRKFLTFSWWLLHRGWRDMMEKVETAVKSTFGPLNPREDISLEKLSALILDVRRRIEGGTPEDRRSHKWLPYLLPPPDQEEMVLRESGMLRSPPSPQSPPEPSQTPTPAPTTSPSPSSTSVPLRRLLDETSDLIESPAFNQILTFLLDATFSHLTDHQIRADAYRIPAPSEIPRVQEVPDIDISLAKAKLASILAVMTRQAHAIGNGVPNEYAQAIEAVKDLESFAAVIYSSHFEFQALATGGVSAKEEAQTQEEVQIEENEGKGMVDTATNMFESVWGKLTG